MNTSILEGKNAVNFGAHGSIGAAVAKEFAAQGAQVFLAGRTKVGLEAVAREITASGGEAKTAVVNQAIEGIAQSSFMKVPATVADTANAAVLIVSDRARMLTGTMVNATAGAALD